MQIHMVFMHARPRRAVTFVAAENTLGGDGGNREERKHGVKLGVLHGPAAACLAPNMAAEDTLDEERRVLLAVLLFHLPATGARRSFKGYQTIGYVWACEVRQDRQQSTTKERDAPVAFREHNR